MKKSRGVLWPLLCLALAALSVFLYASLKEAGTDAYTVRLYRTFWNDEGGYYATRSIAPRPEAAWQSGQHEAEPVTVRFDGAVLHQGAGYGPTTLTGAFAADDVNALCGREVLAEDWPFTWSLYFTNDWYVVSAYAEIRLPEDEGGEAEATLTVYHADHSAPAAVLTWRGGIGEMIKFGAAEL